MTKAQAKKLKVGDRVTWREEMQLTTAAALAASSGEVIEKDYARFKVKWGDGVVAAYLNDFVPQLNHIDIA